MSDAPDRAEGHPVTMRLQRFLARSGVASRRGSEDLISAGRVSVNGEVRRDLGCKVDVHHDLVEVDGVRVEPAGSPVYLMLNKPAGYLTTMSDPYGRPCVAELVPVGEHPGLFPVGRLDMDTTGLLLFTTDGDAAQRLLHPSHHVVKHYVALVDGTTLDRDLEPLRRGMTLDDGPCKPARARVVRREPALLPGPAPSGTALVEVVLTEGRKNQVKRMLGAVGHPVLELHRSSFGPLELDGLAPGAWRELAGYEVQALLDASLEVECGHGQEGPGTREQDAAALAVTDDDAASFGGERGEA